MITRDSRLLFILLVDEVKTCSNDVSISDGGELTGKFGGYYRNLLCIAQ